jgi:hypothetical protein
MARDRGVVLEAENADLRTNVGETKDRLAAEMARAERATAKWESDRSALDRAKDALAVALAQIEDVEGRPL